MTITARREPRYTIEIPVTILSSRGNHEAVTGNVSYRGFFVRTKLSLPKLQLVRVHLKVPRQRGVIDANVVVTNTATSGTVGLGVAFYGLDGDPRGQWEAFIKSLREEGRQSSTPAGPPPDGKRRAETDLVIAVASNPAFERLRDDIAHGSLLVHTSAPLDLDAAVSVQVVHPVTQGRLVLKGVVNRRLEDGGVRVGLRTMDTGARARLTDFLADGPPRRDSLPRIAAFESKAPPVQMSTQG